jgi:L-threonylcarbamoyladenylate synthase
MSAPVLPASDPDSIARAAAVLRGGGLVAFPTETVYGLGAAAFDAGAVARVFAAKARPTFDPLIVHVHDASELPRVVETGEDSRVARLAARFWPGPLTLVLPRRPEVPDIVTSGLETVGVRVPSHEAARALLRAAGPLAAPSANPFGYVSPTTAAHVAERLGDLVDLVLDGGPCAVGVESTILSLDGGSAVLLRPGGVPREEIEAVLGRSLSLAQSGARPLAPGQLDRHYATHTPLRVLGGPAADAPAGGGRVGLLAFGPTAARGYAAVEVLAPDGRLATAAANLFAALRRLDARPLDSILAEPCPPEGLGLAILDRLRRAAARS